LNNGGALRRKAMDCISDFKIIDPRKKDLKDVAINDALSDIQIKASLLNFTNS